MGKKEKAKKAARAASAAAAAGGSSPATKKTHHEEQHPQLYAGNRRYKQTQQRLAAIRDSYRNGLHEKGSIDHDGLVAVSERLGGSMLAPRNKVTVMLMGNHSAGKSSFINWYLSEGGLHKEVQKTGSAITTNSFTVINQGLEGAKKMGADQLLDYFKQLRPLAEEKDGRFRQKRGAQSGDILNALALLPVVSPRLDNVDLIDTPGLVDGNLQYPFDINEVVTFIGSHCDQIIVFLDHVGGSLCARTMDVLESLAAKHAKKIVIYITKIDTIESAADLTKVTQQVAQGLPENLRTQQSLEVRSMFIPTDKAGNVRPVLSEIKAQNRIVSLKDDIDVLVTEKEQLNLERMESDIKSLARDVTRTLKAEKKLRSTRNAWHCWGYLFFAFAWVVIPLWSTLLVATLFPERMPSAVREHPMLDSLRSSLIAELGDVVLPVEMAPHAKFGSLVTFFVGLLLLNKISSICATKVGCRTTAEIAALEEDRSVLICYEKERNNIRSQVLTHSVKTMDG